MGLMGDLAQFAGVVLIAGGVIYMYNRGAFDQILGKKEGEAAEEPEPKEETKEGEELKEATVPVPKPKEDIDIISDTARRAVCKQKFGSNCDAEGKCRNGTRMQLHNCKECLKCFPNTQCKKDHVWSKSTKRCVTKQCFDKFGQDCNNECRSGRENSSTCKECKKLCGGNASIVPTANLALAYAGTYYDGQVIDTAYYVTSPEYMIPRSRPTVMRVAIA